MQITWSLLRVVNHAGRPLYAFQITDVERSAALIRLFGPLRICCCKCPHPSTVSLSSPSPRALFDLEESNRVFEEQGVNAYYRYQLEDGHTFRVGHPQRGESERV